MKTIGEIIHHKTFPFYILDSNGQDIYYEDAVGYWRKMGFDDNRNTIYYENGNGGWEKHEYDSNDNEIYYENSNGYINDSR